MRVVGQWATVIVDKALAGSGATPWPAPGSRVVCAAAADIAAVVPWVRETGAQQLVVVGRDPHRSSVRMAAAVLSGAMPHLPIATLTVACSAFAAAALGHALTQWVDTADDGYRRLAAAAEGVTSGVWLRRLAALDQPSPSLWQHFRSMLPGGTGYLAMMSPVPVVVARSHPSLLAQAGLSPATPGADPAARPQRELMVAADPADRRAQSLADDLGFGGAMHVLPPVVDARAAYGGDGLDFVVWQAWTLDPLPEVARCPVCGGAAETGTCPFCHARVRAGVAIGLHDHGGVVAMGAPAGRR